jgi:hypothetical protein
LLSSQKLFYFASTNLIYHEFILHYHTFFYILLFPNCLCFCASAELCCYPHGCSDRWARGFTELDSARDIITFVIKESTYALAASYDDDGVQIMEMSNSSLSTGALFFTSLTLYPNPVTTTLQIQSPLATEVSYRVYDLTGKALSTHQITGQSHSIDVSALAKGVYLLEATHNNSTTAMQFVKE